MFDRASLKHAAKQRVSQNRWMAVLVCLVATLVGAATGFTPSFSFSLPVDSGPSVQTEFGNLFFSDTVAVTIAVIAMIVALIIIVVAFAFRTFVSNVIRVGLLGWFLEYSRGENPPFETLFSRFNHYKNTMLGMLLANVYIFLWSLLFVIPGIIKSYSYMLVPYLLYENPSLTPREAIRMSETMMDGWKWEAFKFDLSFFGWIILDGFTCGLLSIFFVNPFYYTASAMLYDNIKYNAVYDRHVIDPTVLNMPISPVSYAETDDQVYDGVVVD